MSFVRSAEVMHVECRGFELGYLIWVPRVMKKHVRFGEKSNEAAGIKESFSGYSQGIWQRGTTPVEGLSEGKLLLASGVEVVGLGMGKKSPVRHCTGMLGCHQDVIQIEICLANQHHKSKMLSCLLQYPQARAGISLKIYRIMNRLSVRRESK